MPSSLAAWDSSLVHAASSGLGVGSEGWLWVTMMWGDGLDNGGPQHLGGPHHRRVHVALVDDPLADHDVLGVEQQHPQLLLGQAGHLRREQLVNVIGGRDRGRGVRPFRLDLHAVAQRDLSQEIQVVAQGVQQRLPL